MAATLNQDDIKLLKSIFPTKDDLDAKIDTLESRINLQFKAVDERFDLLEPIIAKSFEDLEHRVKKPEDVARIPTIQ